jgi:threonine/homoserine/homoserine lactone efflux protein
VRAVLVDLPPSLLPANGDPKAWVDDRNGRSMGPSARLEVTEATRRGRAARLITVGAAAAVVGSVALVAGFVTDSLPPIYASIVLWVTAMALIYAGLLIVRAKGTWRRRWWRRRGRLE